MPDDPKRASLRQIAKVLGVTQPLLSELRRKHPTECPPKPANGRESVEAWRTFLDSKQIKDEARNPEKYADKATEEARKLRIANERAEIKLKHERGLYLPRSEVMASITRVRAQERQAFMAFCDNLALEFGHQGPEIAAKLRAHTKRMLEQLVVSFGDKEDEK